MQIAIKVLLTVLSVVTLAWMLRVMYYIGYIAGMDDAREMLEESRKSIGIKEVQP